MILRKGISIGKIFGINLRLHSTFLWFLFLLLSLELLSNLSIEDKFIRIFYDILLFIIVFGSVLLHELGHSLMALHYNIKVREIILLPIGGVAEIPQIIEEPRKEFIVAISGPMVNIFIIIGTFLMLPLLNLIAMKMSNQFIYYIYIYTIKINAIMFVFNLFPAFPLDGGRIYRSYLTKKYGFLVATEKAAKLGKILAILLGIVAILQSFNIMNIWTGFNLFTIIIAIFLYYSANAELNFVKLKYSIEQNMILYTQFQKVMEKIAKNPNSIIFMEDEIQELLKKRSF